MITEFDAFMLPHICGYVWCNILMPFLLILVKVVLHYDQILHYLAFQKKKKDITLSLKRYTLSFTNDVDFQENSYLDILT